MNIKSNENAAPNPDGPERDSQDEMAQYLAERHPFIEIEKKTPQDYGREFSEYLDRAMDGAQAIWSSWDRVWRDRNLPADWDNTRKDMEYNKGVLQYTVLHWQNHRDEFFLKYARENLRTSFDVLESKEYKSAFKELEERARFDREAIERLNANPVKLEPLPIQQKEFTGKIKWTGPTTKLAIVFQWLSQMGFIDRAWPRLVEGHFVLADGTSPKNLLQAADKKTTGKASAEFLEKDITKGLGSRLAET